MLAFIRTACALAGLSLAVSCVAPPEQKPTAPAPARPAAAPPPPPPPSADWRDWPVSAGTWSYRAIAGGSVANFGGAGGDALLSVRCEQASRRVFVARKVVAYTSGAMTLRTSFGAVSWPTQASAEAPPAPTYAIAARAASDTGLDQMISSRGRFVIEVPGEAPVVVPAWAEVARVIEDCRG